MPTSRADIRLLSATHGSNPVEGFTLLELILAVTLLATFILPMLYLIAEARVRMIRVTNERQARGLAQEKLHDRVHYYEIEDSGVFEDEGHPDWTWEVDPPEMRTQGEQIVLTYTIRVHIPQRVSEDSPSGEGSTFEYSLWTFPDEKWYEEQDLLFERGEYSPLYGDPSMPTTGSTVR